MDDGFDESDRATLRRLEEAMWRPETRFDPAFQAAHFAPDFIEFGRSGRIYTRAQIIRTVPTSFHAQLPLPRFAIRRLTADLALVTYDSHATFDGVVESAHRSSLWSRTPTGWAMRFHQGTPFEPEEPAPAPAPVPAADADMIEPRKPGLAFTRTWSDDDLLSFRIEVCDGTSSFVNEVYVGVDDFEAAVEALRTFQGGIQGGSHDLAFGGFGPTWAGGAFRARLEVVAGRLLLSCEQESSFEPFGHETVASRATLLLHSEPALLDRFVRELAAVARGHRQTAFLEGV